MSAMLGYYALCTLYPAVLLNLCLSLDWRVMTEVRMGSGNVLPFTCVPLIIIWVCKKL